MEHQKYVKSSINVTDIMLINSHKKDQNNNNYALYGRHRFVQKGQNSIREFHGSCRN